MQTFLPYPSFSQSAKCLDSRRLNKQIQECVQILNTLENKNQSGWRNHPAVLQWQGYEEALKTYLNCCIDEWLTRKKKNGERITSNTNKYQKINHKNFKLPWWLGKYSYHSSHRSNLLRKDFNWYKQFNWFDNPENPYWWPTKNNM